MRLALALLLLAAVAGEGMLTDRLEGPGGAVTRVYLPGGPTVLLQPEAGATAAAVALALPSGSRREPVGGLAHLLEHLVFRSTPHFSAGSLPLALEAVGARAGARTTPDSTVFWEVVPAAQVDLALRIEADRLDGLTFSSKDLEREKELVLAEIVGREARADHRVEAALRRSLWPGESVVPVGDPVEVAGATPDDLRALYERTYRREHAVLSVVGGFDPEAVTARLQELFPPPASPATEEAPPSATPQPAAPPAAEEPKEAGVLMAAMASPPFESADFAALAVLDAALTDGATSRLQRALKGAQARVEADPDLDDGFHRVAVFLGRGSDPAEVEAVLLREIEALRTSEMPPAELASAERRARARWFRSWQAPGTRAVAMAQAEAAGRLDALLDLPERLTALKPVKVREAAARVFDPARLVIYRPAPGPGPSAPAPGAGSAEAEFQRRRLENGLTVLVWPEPAASTVTLRGYLTGGSLLDPPDREGLTALSARLLGRGTVTREGETFQWDLEDHGMRLNFRGDRQVVTVDGWCLKEDLPRLLDLLADALRHPQVGPEAVIQARREALAGTLATTSWDEAVESFLARLYPPGHPYGRPAQGTEASLQAASVDEIRAHLVRVSRPDRLTLCFVGAVTEAEVMQHLRPGLTSWFAEGAAPRAEAPEVPLPAPSLETVAGSGAYSLVLAGHPGPSRRDPDWYAFNLLNQILGGNPATSRLALRLRDEEKLGPSASARLVPLSGPVPWAVVLQVRPDKVDRALEVVREEMERMRREPPTEDEVKRAVAALEGRLQVSLAEPGARAELLSTLEYYHLSDCYPSGFAGLYSGITPKQILETAQRRLHPEALVVVVAEPPKATAP